MADGVDDDAAGATAALRDTPRLLAAGERIDEVASADGPGGGAATTPAPLPTPRRIGEVTSADAAAADDDDVDANGDPLSCVDTPRTCAASMATCS